MREMDRYQGWAEEPVASQDACRGRGGQENSVRVWDTREIEQDCPS